MNNKKKKNLMFVALQRNIIVVNIYRRQNNDLDIENGVNVENNGIDGVEMALMTLKMMLIQKTLHKTIPSCTSFS